MHSRLEKLRQYMKDARLDGILVYSKENRRYLSGFTGSAGYLLIGMKDAYFVTDFRYKEQARLQCPGYEIIIHNNNIPQTLSEYISASRISRLGIEEDFMTVSFFDELKRTAVKIELTSAKSIMDSLRILKDADEIANIRRAAEITDAAFSHILGYIKPGMREQEISLELEFYCKKSGATALSFDPIVASGHRSALPHGIASEKTINNGEFLTLDFGCVYNGYCSDMTRTVFIGKTTDRHYAKHHEIYQTVLQAQQAALEYIKPGVIGKDVDKVARDIIRDAGYGEFFGHGLGHGVGLAVHEEPRLNTLGEKVLRSGMIVTDEPGIYIPDFGGVRIEDLVLVTENGCEPLSKSPKYLIEV